MKPINVVYDQEKTTKKEAEPLRWVLLTTKPVATLSQALCVLLTFMRQDGELKISIRLGKLAQEQSVKG